MTRLLRTEGLVRHFGGVRALGPVDFAIDPGLIVGLIGPNGSGKSTFFNVVTGFLRPTSGKVFWEGHEITGRPPGARAKLGLVRTFQEKMIFSGLSVRENLQFALIQSGAPDFAEASLRQAMDYARLPHATLSQMAGDLSWGQCRMLGMVLALVLKPKLLLLDEPFAGLNRIIASQVTEMLLKLRDDGMGVVIVEHDMDLLLPLCDRITVFAEGQILSEGTSQEVLARPDVRAAYFGSETVAENQ
jgi:ABC-type branched-subunit amino acid transport system ATPase component